MALDILSIPTMSTEPERLSSGAKISLTDRRNRMGDDLLQALECLNRGTRSLIGNTSCWRVFMTH
jgi:hypothetical protein